MSKNLSHEAMVNHCLDSAKVDELHFQGHEPSKILVHDKIGQPLDYLFQGSGSHKTVLPPNNARYQPSAHTVFPNIGINVQEEN